MRSPGASSNPAPSRSPPAAIKIANNFVLGCAIEALGEGFALTRKYGVAPDVFYNVLAEGLFNCWAYKTYGKFIADEKYLPAGQRAVTGLKDANLALAAGEAVGVPLPSGNVWRDRLDRRRRPRRRRARLGGDGEGSGPRQRAYLARRKCWALSRSGRGPLKHFNNKDG